MVNLLTRHTRSESARRLAIAGYFGTGNLGNDGSLAAMLDMLAPGTVGGWQGSVVCVTHAPDRVRESSDIDAIPFHFPRRHSGRSLPGRLLARIQDLRWTFSYIRDVDAVLVPGTGALADEEPGAVASFLVPVVFAAMVLRRPVYLVSIGAEPQPTSSGRRRSSFIVRHATYCTTRDAYSALVLQELSAGRIDPPEVFPDLVFSSPLLSRSAPTEKVLGLGVLEYRGLQSDGDEPHNRFLEAMRQFTAKLIEDGWQIRLLAGSAVDTAALTQLQDLLAETFPGLGHEIVQIRPCERLAEVEAQIADCRIVISSRFHNLVCALRAGRPAISLGYGPKQDNLMHDFGLSAYTQDIRKLDIVRLRTQFDRAVADETELTEAITAHRDTLIERGAIQQAALLQELNAPASRRYRRRRSLETGSPS